MGRVSETVAMPGVDRGPDGGGVGDRLFNRKEISYIYTQHKFGCPYRIWPWHGIVKDQAETDASDAGWEKCINSGGNCGDPACAFIRRMLVSRREGGAPPLHREVDPVQRPHAVVVDWQEFQAASQWGAWDTVRADILNDALGQYSMDGPVKKPAKCKPFRISEKLHNRLCEMFQRGKCPQKRFGIKFVTFILGASRNGVVTDIELIAPGRGGCETYPQIERDELSRAMTALILGGLKPVGFGRLSSKYHGGHDGNWLHWGDAKMPMFLSVSLDYGFVATDLSDRERMNYEIV